MKKLLSVILSIAMLLSMQSAVFADGVDVPVQEAKIKVGICADFKPFEYYDENKELAGFDIDLMNYIGEKIGFEIEFADMSFDKLIPAVVNGDVDCALSAMTITEERDFIIDYTMPYLSVDAIYDGEKSFENYAIVFPNNSKEKAILKEAAGDPYKSLYTLVDNAILSLKKDGTIHRLIEKYDLNNETNDNEGFKKTYTSIVTTEDTQDSGSIADGGLEGNADIPRYETREEIGLTNPHPSEWAEKDIDVARAVGITDDKGYFYQENITREEFCEIVYNTVKAVQKKTYTINTSFKFEDTDNESVIILNRLGIINGKSETEFAPNDLLTREEAATIIIRMINNVMPMPATEMWFEYDDINEISEWASDSIQTISNLGFMNGVGSNKFAPKDYYTTEQAIATLVRVYRGAEAAGIIEKNSDIGIIGGADGPTSIIIGDNTVKVDKRQEYDNFYIEVKKNTKRVDDFYIDEAIKLTTESGTLASDKDFISYYAPGEDTRNKVLSIGAVQYSKPTEIYYMAANREQIKKKISPVPEAGSLSIDIDR